MGLCPMSDLNHSLYTDFPQYRERIHQLKLENPEFAAKAAEYHKLDHSVRGHERAHIPISNDEFGHMKMRRLQLKDELLRMLQ